jgi:agmatine/peptidylarginine deiminase
MMSANEFKEKMFEETADYVDRMAMLLKLPLENSQYRSGTIENFIRIEEIAKTVTEFSLPDKIEAGPVFEP